MFQDTFDVTLLSSTLLASLSTSSNFFLWVNADLQTSSRDLVITGALPYQRTARQQPQYLLGCKESLSTGSRLYRRAVHQQSYSGSVLVIAASSKACCNPSLPAKLDDPDDCDVKKCI